VKNVGRQLLKLWPLALLAGLLAAAPFYLIGIDAVGLKALLDFGPRF